MTQKVVSFDIGIKNMAYCIFDVLEDSSVKLLDWKVINVAKRNTSQEDVQYCEHKYTTKKKEKVCGKVSKFNKNGVYVCEKHANASSKWVLPKKEYTEKNLQKMKMQELKEFIKRENIFFFTSLCDKLKKQDIIDKFTSHYKDRCWEENPTPMKEAKASEIDLITVGRNLHRVLLEDDYIKGNKISHVIIENQISPIANRMKTIQGMLAQFFIFQSVPVIEFVSSSNKLKDFVKEYSIGNEKTKSTYKQHKNDGIYFCKQFLDVYFTKEWKEFFEKYGKKKDDLADCFLQGIWYINKKLITNAYNLKINNVNTS